MRDLFLKLALQIWLDMTKKFRIPDIVNYAGYEIQTLISWKPEYTNCFVITISHTTLFKLWLCLHFEFWVLTENPRKTKQAVPNEFVYS